MISKYIFVVGTGRCGTKWLNDWLLSHPRCFGGPESHVFDRMRGLFMYWPGTGPIPWLNNNEDKMMKMVRGFLRDFYSARQVPPADCMVDPTPLHLKYRDLIRRVLPTAKFVHIYRDGKYFVWSITRKRYYNEQKKAKDWSLYWVKVMEDMKNKPREYQIDIKYEDLLANPENSRRITEFLGLEHHKDIAPWETPTVNTRHTFYDPERWRGVSDEEKRDMIVMNEQLIANGYAPVE